MLALHYKFANHEHIIKIFFILFFYLKYNIKIINEINNYGKIDLNVDG